MRLYSKIKIRILLLIVLSVISGCSIMPRQAYQDNFPQPCTPDWFTAIEQELNLVDTTTNQPVPGSDLWLKAADDKLALAAQTGHQIGDIEWCHQLHQRLIGL